MPQLRLALILAAILAIAVVAGAFLAEPFLFPTGNRCGLTQVEAITLPNTTGRIDHMAYQPGTHRLYVAALGNNTLDIVNVTSGTFQFAVKGFSEPQGVLYSPSTGSVFVSNGGTGVVNVLDASSLRRLANISLGSDADNLRLDPESNLVYVGYGGGALAAIDPSNYSVLWSAPLASHPEGFQLSPDSGRIFVNVAANGYVAVVSTVDHSVTTRWPLAGATGNFPMAIDAVNGRLFIGTRSPSQLVVLDSSTGVQLASTGIPQDPDDVYYSPAVGCVFVTSGAGYVSILRETDPSHISLLASLATSPGARTSLLAGSSGPFFVAAPASGTQPARILVYNIST